MFVAAQDYDVGVDSHSLQFLDRMLRRFGFVLVGAFEERDQRDVDKQTVFPSCFQRNLTDGLYERL